MEQYERVLPSIPGSDIINDEPVTTVVIESLRPASDCRIHLKAIYDRGSDDPGMYINTATLAASKLIYGRSLYSGGSSQSVQYNF